jgi:hypothetical protein
MNFCLKAAKYAAVNRIQLVQKWLQDSQWLLVHWLSYCKKKKVTLDLEVLEEIFCFNLK